MALETLKGVKEIGGFNVKEIINGNELIHKDDFIIADHANNVVSFKIQENPVKEVGVNGCQVDTHIHYAVNALEVLNRNFPTSYNQKAIGYLKLAIGELLSRKEDREKRGVEGFYKQ